MTLPVQSANPETGPSFRAIAAERYARWLSNGLGVISSGASLFGWVILGSTYIYAQSIPDSPGSHGISRNLQQLIGAFYFFMSMQVASAFALVLALIPSRNRKRSLLFGLPLAAVPVGAVCLSLVRMFLA
jgi:hypothetical protein